MTDFLTCQLCNGSKILLDDPCPCDSVAYLNLINNNKMKSIPPALSPEDFAKRFDATMETLDELGVADAMLSSIQNLAFDVLNYTRSKGTVMLGTNGAPFEPSLDDLEDLEPKTPRRSTVDTESFGNFDEKFDVLFDDDDTSQVNLIATTLAGHVVYGTTFVQRLDKDGDNE